jgi:methylthioribose-1-phosphate isomerase
MTMRTIYWDTANNQVKTIDQRELPGKLVWVSLRTGKEVADAIQGMVIRGAPVIGAAGAFGIVLDAFQSHANTLVELTAELAGSRRILQAARPTAVNLRWALSRMNRIFSTYEGSVEGMRILLLEEAERISEEDIQTSKRMADFGRTVIEDGDVIIHHCNTGSLATVEGGTALGAIMAAWKQGKRLKVLVNETRPLLQGARLTAWELQHAGIPFEIICDGAAGYFLQKRLATKVLFGADRVAANGDLANKIGTYMLANAAKANAIPVYAVFPISSIDPACVNGEQIEIEFRGEQEVLDLVLLGKKTSPEGAHALNPAFDITPNHLITAWITDRGIIYPPFNMDSPENPGNLEGITK